MQYHHKHFLHMMMPRKMDIDATIAPCLDRANSVHVKGLVTWTNTFWKFSFRSASDPVLSIRISAVVLLRSRDIWVLSLHLESSAVVPSLAMSRWSWVLGSTQTTTIGFVHLSILASNNKGTSSTIILHPFIHSFNTSKRMPVETYGASNLNA